MKESINSSLNTMKMLGVDMINVANSGHPGIVLGAAPIVYALYANVMNIDPTNPSWVNRDRFVMSAGHGSALLYSALFMSGYELILNDLARFRRLGSKTPGHPDISKTPGVDCTTGPLGQGFATAVGIALGERYLSATLDKLVPKQKLIDYYTYVLCSDGDLMEGISSEAAAFAGKQELNKLIVLYDSNDITHDGRKDFSMKEDILTRFKAHGWHTDYVAEGADIASITKAILKAKRVNKPSLIEIKTIIGRDSYNQNNNIVHGKPLSKDDLKQLRTKLGISTDIMEVNDDDVNFFRDSLRKRINPYISGWNSYCTKFNATTNSDIQSFLRFINNGDLSLDFSASNFKIQEHYSEEIRESNSKIINVISEKTPYFLGGSADLAASCKTNISGSMEMSPAIKTGKNIYFGVREQAMGAILNGMALSKLRVFGSTFLVFSDYLKSSIRQSAKMNLPVTYVFTHDSIDIGQDGSTHQPIEQLVGLRATPNLDVYRPCDINEVIGSWEQIIKRNKPAVLAISKQNIEVLNTSNGNDVSKGAYMVLREVESIKGIILATGSEVTTAIRVAQVLRNVRVISVPCLEIFLEQGNEYYEQILPKDVKVISLEASSTLGWGKYSDYQIGIDDFGTSGTYDEVMDKYGLNYEKVLQQVKGIIES